VNLRAIQVRHESVEWNVPPLDNHCIIIQTGPSARMSVFIGGQSFDRRVETGEIIIVPAGIPSYWRLNDEVVNESLHLYLSPQLIREAAASFGFGGSHIAIEPQIGVCDEQLHHLGMSLLCELKEANVLGRLTADSLAYVLALQLVRRSSILKDVKVSRGGMAPNKLRKAIEFINQSLEQVQTVAVSAIAAKVGMSYFHFSRAFKQSMGVSPVAYMIEGRVEQAKKLLAETDVPISEIAQRVGFSSQSHFSATFRKLARTTPQAFRRML
jgi:AraC family transcriptional regulator